MKAERHDIELDIDFGKIEEFMLKCSDLDYCRNIPDFFYDDWKSGSCYSHRMKTLEQALRIIR